jgi:hypothetical protein
MEVLIEISLQESYFEPSVNVFGSSQVISGISDFYPRETLNEAINVIKCAIRNLDFTKTIVKFSSSANKVQRRIISLEILENMALNDFKDVLGDES